MKKITSIFLVIIVLVLSISSITVFAASGDTGVDLVAQGLAVKLVEDSTGLVTATVSIKGPVTNIAAMDFGLNINPSEVYVRDLNGNNISATTTVTDIFSYITLDTSLVASHWMKSSATINFTTNYVRWGITATTNVASYVNLGAGVSKDMFKFYFQKKTGATISNSTFTMRSAVSNFCQYVDKDALAVQNKNATNLDKFSVIVTPYVPAGPVVPGASDVVDVVTGDITTSETVTTETAPNGLGGSKTVSNSKAVSIPSFVPAIYDTEIKFGDIEEFGVALGSGDNVVHFKSLTNWTKLSADNGRFFIKFIHGGENNNITSALLTTRNYVKVNGTYYYSTGISKGYSFR